MSDEVGTDAEQDATSESLASVVYQQESLSTRLWYTLTQPLQCFLLPTSAMLHQCLGARVPVFKTARLQRLAKHATLDSVVTLNVQAIRAQDGAIRKQLKQSEQWHTFGRLSQIELCCVVENGRLYPTSPDTTAPAAAAAVPDTACVQLHYHRSNQTHQYVDRYGVLVTTYPETYELYGCGLSTEVLTVLVKCEYHLNGGHAGNMGWFQFVNVKIKRIQQLYGLQEAFHWNSVYAQVLGEPRSISSWALLSQALPTTA